MMITYYNQVKNLLAEIVLSHTNERDLIAFCYEHVKQDFVSRKSVISIQ
jgi:hypothetical protein